MRKSKTALFKDLAALAATTPAFSKFANVVETGLKHLSVSDETYGRDSRIYLRFASAERKHEAQAALRAYGYSVDSNWTRQNPYGIEVPVTYFKGCRWDE